ncbi:indole-3-glycerol phosphate synthase TrpC [Kiritimatiella glycovorans]|uniref:Indole-3-glycerol phosphate synthase n=1 Tax=Kiritimatiella glycovorans TaxID=1307763 RepID=A0A0G3EGJ0_9BACT|nr:indole-3-glycerol phosphate synthase TrpC [Kiritimatiella glycovorans]AKJ65458.1 Indole-3-glycerol phosphate synthase [Kiritimatiella glycovorans]
MNILEEIVAHKRREIAELREHVPAETMREQAGAADAPAPDWTASLCAEGFGFIAEIKRRSPSAGVIRADFDPAALARAYEDRGAQAVSCLMDYRYFGGGEDDFEAARKSTRLPMLYKEFVVEDWQVYHARMSGASAVLLIAAVLEPDELNGMAERCRACGLEPLVEIHSAEEAAAAVDSGARWIGINNRDLRTFETRIETTLRLRPGLPDNALVVSESGIRSAQDIRTLREADVAGVLVGEHLLRQPDPGAALAALREGLRP